MPNESRVLLWEYIMIRAKKQGFGEFQKEKLLKSRSIILKNLMDLAIREGNDYDNPKKTYSNINRISRETGLDHKTVKKHVDEAVKDGTILETKGTYQSRLLCHWMSGTGKLLSKSRRPRVIKPIE